MNPRPTWLEKFRHKEPPFYFDIENIFYSIGGTDLPSNLITLCKKFHEIEENNPFRIRQNEVKATFGIPKDLVKRPPMTKQSDSSVERLHQ